MNPAQILILSDDPRFRAVLRSAVAASGYSVREARTEAHGQSHLSTGAVQIAIIDLHQTGAALAATCRHIRMISDAALIVLGCGIEEAELIAVLDAGADEYLRKPVSTPELLAHVRVLLRRLQPSCAPEREPVRLDGLQIDFNARRVFSHGRHYSLTPKEFDLLQYLIEHANATISHTRLLRNVWGANYGHETAALRVVVNQLRKKIESDPAHPRYLLTEPWVGYRFEKPL